jgi:hypothetical protein
MTDANPDRDPKPRGQNPSKPVFAANKRSERYRVSSTRRWHFGVFFVVVLGGYSSLYSDWLYETPWLLALVLPAYFVFGWLFGEAYLTLYRLHWGGTPQDWRWKPHGQRRGSPPQEE